MSAVLSILGWALWVFFLLLLFRLVMEYVFMFARSFRPEGPFAAVLELTYSVTDPPVKALRRIIPPLRLGSVSLDLSFVLLLFACSFGASTLLAAAQRS